MKITKEMLLQKNDPETTWNSLRLMHKINDKPFTLIAHSLKTDKRLPIGTFKRYILNGWAQILECTNTAEGDAFGIKVNTTTTHTFKLNDDVDFIFIVDDGEIRLNDYKEKHESITINQEVLHNGDFVRLKVSFGSFEYKGTAIVADVSKYNISFMINELGSLEQYGVTTRDLEDPRMDFDCELLHEAENPYVNKKG